MSEERRNNRYYVQQNSIKKYIFLNNTFDNSGIKKMRQSGRVGKRNEFSVKNNKGIQIQSFFHYILMRWKDKHRKNVCSSYQSKISQQDPNCYHSTPFKLTQYWQANIKWKPILMNKLTDIFCRDTQIAVVTRSHIPLLQNPCTVYSQISDKVSVVIHESLATYFHRKKGNIITLILFGILLWFCVFMLSGFVAL